MADVRKISACQRSHDPSQVLAVCEKNILKFHLFNFNQPEKNDMFGNSDHTIIRFDLYLN